MAAAPPTSPSIKECPKPAEIFKSELTSFTPDKLKPSKDKTVEKVVMPTKDVVQLESAMDSKDKCVDDVTRFRKGSLSHCDTDEKNVLPSADDIIQEKTHQQMIDGVEHFDIHKMKHAETTEKVLPVSAEEYLAGKQEKKEFRSSIEHFDTKAKLKHIEPTTKEAPVTAEEFIAIKNEKKQFRTSIEGFDTKAKLKHIPEPKAGHLPTADEIKAEKEAA